MSDTSAIEWTDATWNPVRGCVKVSPGCAHCYAETFAERWRGVPGHPYEQGFDLRLVPEKLTEPLRWKKPRRIFVNSMSDLFQDGVPDSYIDQVFAVMALCPQHTFQVLTKRADRMLAYVSHIAKSVKPIEEAGREMGFTFNFNGIPLLPWPIPNVWLGVSVENQHFADERIPLLLQTPAAVRFISAEPLLGPVDLNALPDPRGDPSWDASALHGVRECPFGATVQREQINKLDWVIVGGESGPGARPFDIAWARSIVAQCKAADVACFVKQFGAHVVGDCSQQFTEHGFPTVDRPATVGRRILLSKKGGDPAEWPEDLRVREFPAARAARGEAP